MKPLPRTKLDSYREQYGSRLVIARQLRLFKHNHQITKLGIHFYRVNLESGGSWFVNTGEEISNAGY